jgi:hypothetical protein
VDPRLASTETFLDLVERAAAIALTNPSSTAPAPTGPTADPITDPTTDPTTDPQPDAHAQTGKDTPVSATAPADKASPAGGADVDLFARLMGELLAAEPGDATYADPTVADDGPEDPS